MNPLLKNTFCTPRKTIPFDIIRVEHFEPAFMEGMRLENEAIQRIIDNPDTPTFQNTIQPRTGEILERTSNIFFNLLSANTSDQMDQLAEKITPLLTEHENRILHNSQLFEKISYIHKNPGKLTEEEQTLLNEVHERFRRSGACLTQQEKEKLAALESELSTLTVHFNQNVLKETNAFQLHIQDTSDLAGLPDTAIGGAAQAASEKGLGGWLFTLHAPSYMPFMTYAENRHLRKKMYMAKNSICCQGNEHDNREIVSRLVNLRRQVAQTLGFSTYADYILTRRMAGKTSTVNRFVEELLDAYLPVAQEELAELTRLAQETEGADFQVMPWDYAYYSHRMKLKLHDLDAEMLRPYFSLDRVCQGVFRLAETLYGITFKQNEDIAVYHPDVKAYEVMDTDGTYLATLYTDFHPRSGKQSGAWMTNYSEQYIDEDGTDHRPHVSIVMNFTKPTAEHPSLLTLSEVETFLHEFGHALHSIFSRVRFSALSGTNVRWDFVEFPSQFMENYATQKEFLNTFAFHYQTGKPIPEELIERIRNSRNFHCGYQCVRQLSFCLLDMAYYSLTEKFAADITDFEQTAWARTQLLPHPEGTSMSVQFSHIMSGGYSAGYYSYKWAEVLDADAFELFQQDGIFNRKTAHSLRTEVLSRGATQPPMNLYVNFRGRQPSIEALLHRNGIRK